MRGVVYGMIGAAIAQGVRFSIEGRHHVVMCLQQMLPNSIPIVTIIRGRLGRLVDSGQ